MNNAQHYSGHGGVINKMVVSTLISLVVLLNIHIDFSIEIPSLVMLIISSKQIIRKIHLRMACIY